MENGLAHDVIHTNIGLFFGSVEEENKKKINTVACEFQAVNARGNLNHSRKTKSPVEASNSQKTQDRNGGFLSEIRAFAGKSLRKWFVCAK